MKSAPVLTGLLASAALAQPHGHGRVHQHRRRDDVVTDWTTVWETETVIEYIDVTTTTWFTPGVTVSTSTSSTSSQTPAQFFEGASSSKASTPPPAAPAAVPLTTQAAPPPPSTTSTTSTTPVYTPPPVQQPTTSTQAPAATSGSGSSGGSGGSGTMVGDLTYYTIGVGACGEDDTGKDMTDPIVALSYLLMGSESNDNPYCGKQITISYGGKQTTAIVKDKCMGCTMYSIDVSEIVFIDVLGDLSIGREQVEWWFS